MKIYSMLFRIKINSEEQMQIILNIDKSLENLPASKENLKTFFKKLDLND
jgi:hypothetical protein